MSAFEELGICPEIIQAVEEAPQKEPTVAGTFVLWLSRKSKTGPLKCIHTNTTVFFPRYLALCQDDWLLPTPVQQEVRNRVGPTGLKWEMFGNNNEG